MIPTYNYNDKIETVTENRYEMVLVASKHARHLNAKRLAKLARLQEGSTEVDIEARKMTMVALKEVIDGKVNFQRTDRE
jgi:DNA-directed RNA polymerase omega subunit